MSLIRIPKRHKSEAEIEREEHLTRPPRLEGAVKNAMMNPVRKPASRKQHPHVSQSH
ncbi:MAG: hypothetical protein KGI73_02355 [Patescibacteria group bacterium]|nr:hypothetical protein [Patescibacteria group bacterium]